MDDVRLHPAVLLMCSHWTLNELMPVPVRYRNVFSVNFLTNRDIIEYMDKVRH